MKSCGMGLLRWCYGIMLLCLAACDDPTSNQQSGTVLVRISAHGNGMDADGFSITFRDQTHRLGTGDTLRITGTPPGDHVLRLGDVASHCESLSDSTIIRVEPNRDVSVELTVECYGDLLYSEWYDHYNDQLFYLDGSGVPRKLTPTLPGGQWSARWAPDGTRVVFERIMPNETDIYIADLLGNVRPLANRAGDTETMADWSPDGAWIVYVLIEGPEPFTRTDIRLIRPDGSMDHSLFNDGGIGISPVWSPDGQYIAFGCWRAVHSICYVRPNGEWVGAASVVLNSPQKLAWSPDGSRIAFEDFSGVQSIKILRVDNGTLTTPHAASVTFGAPQWSSDGRQLALTAMENGISRAYVARTDGAEVRLAADSIRWMGGWSPDNARVGIGVAPTSIHLATPDGSRRALLTAVDTVLNTTWRPSLAAQGANAMRVSRPSTLSTLPMPAPRTIKVRADARGMRTSIEPIRP